MSSPVSLPGSGSKGGKGDVGATKPPYQTEPKPTVSKGGMEVVFPGNPTKTEKLNAYAKTGALHPVWLEIKDTTAKGKAKGGASSVWQFASSWRDDDGNGVLSFESGNEEAQSMLIGLATVLGRADGRLGDDESAFDLKLGYLGSNPDIIYFEKESNKLVERRIKLDTLEQIAGVTLEKTVEALREQGSLRGAREYLKNVVKSESARDGRDPDAPSETGDKPLVDFNTPSYKSYEKLKEWSKNKIGELWSWIFLMMGNLSWDDIPLLMELMGVIGKLRTTDIAGAVAKARHTKDQYLDKLKAKLVSKLDHMPQKGSGVNRAQGEIEKLRNQIQRLEALDPILNGLLSDGMEFAKQNAEGAQTIRGKKERVDSGGR